MKKECCNLNEVIQEYYSYLKAYILKKVGDPGLAEDIVQQVMIELIESHSKDQRVTNIKAWLFQVSRNTIYDYYKSRDLLIDFSDDWNLADKQVSENSKIIVADYVAPMIRLLDKKYAVPLEMSDIEELPQKDIAEKLGLSLLATKMRIQRGRTKLRELFQECCEIEYDQNGNVMHCTVKDSCKPLKEIQNRMEK